MTLQNDDNGKMKLHKRLNKNTILKCVPLEGDKCDADLYLIHARFIPMDQTQKY